MPFIEIITDLKSQAQLSKIINKESVNNCEIMYIREKNIENISYWRPLENKSKYKSYTDDDFKYFYNYIRRCNQTLLNISRKHRNNAKRRT